MAIDVRHAQRENGIGPVTLLSAGGIAMNVLITGCRFFYPLRELIPIAIITLTLGALCDQLMGRGLSLHGRDMVHSKAFYNIVLVISLFMFTFLRCIFAQ